MRYTYEMFNKLEQLVTTQWSIILIKVVWEGNTWQIPLLVWEIWC